MARAALSSDSLASLVISSRSAFSWLSSPSNFLLSIGHSSSLAVSSHLGVSSSRLRSRLLIHLQLGVTDLQSILLDGGLGLSIASNGVLKSQAKISCISFQLLLHPQGLGLALGLSLEGSLHRVQRLRLGLLDQKELFLLLSQATFDLLSDSIKLQVTVLAKKKTSLASLIVTKSLDVIELSSQSRLLFGQDVKIVVKISNNAKQIRILTSNLILGSGIVSKCKVGIVNLLVNSIESLHHFLVSSVSRCLSSHNLISSSTSIRDLIHYCHLVLLDLALHFTERINLPGKVRSLRLSLGTGLALSLKLLFHGLHTALELLDSLLSLGNQILFIIKFGSELVVVLILISNNNLQISLAPLKISNSVLSHLEVTLNLSLLFLQGSPALFLLIQATLKFTQSGLKL